MNKHLDGVRNEAGVSAVIFQSRGRGHSRPRDFVRPQAQSADSTASRQEVSSALSNPP